MARKSGRWLRIVAVLVVVGLIAVVAWPKPRVVDVGVVERGDVRETFEAEGRTRLVERFVVSAPVAGVARRLLLEPGDPVEAGQVVVVLDAPVAAPLDPRGRAAAEAEVAAARARLASAEQDEVAAIARARQAEAEEQRLATLASRGFATAEAAERAGTERTVAERAAAASRFAVQAATENLRVAEAALRFGVGGGDEVLELVAPVRGVVVRRHFESARPVAAGEALLEIGDPARLEIEVDVLSSDAVRLVPGTPVEVVRWGGTAPLAANVSRVEPGGFTKFSALGVEEQRVWTILAFDPAEGPPPRLGDAYRVHARFVVARADGAVRVPSSALFRHGGEARVFRVEGGRLRAVAVDVGLIGEGYTEVRSGLRVGETIVVHPSRELEDGARVRPRERAGRTGG